MDTIGPNIQYKHKEGATLLLLTAVLVPGSGLLCPGWTIFYPGHCPAVGETSWQPWRSFQAMPGCPWMHPEISLGFWVFPDAGEEKPRKEEQAVFPLSQNVQYGVWANLTATWTLSLFSRVREDPTWQRRDRPTRKGTPPAWRWWEEHSDPRERECWRAL